MIKKVAAFLLLPVFLSGCAVAPLGDEASFDFLVKVAIASVSAVLSFLGSFVLYQIKESRTPHKQLSYDLIITRGLISFADAVQENLRVLYGGEDVENLYHVVCVIRNTGNTVVKNQFIRFEFSPDVRLVDFYFDPKPEKEFGVEEVHEPELAAYEKRYLIRHLEKGAQVGFCFVASSKGEVDVRLHPFNEAGDVEFVPKSVSRDITERVLVGRFIYLYLLFILLPSIFDMFPSPIGHFSSGIVKVAILMVAFPYLRPFVKKVVEVIFRLASVDTIETDISIRESQVSRLDISTKKHSEHSGK